MILSKVNKYLAIRYKIIKQRVIIKTNNSTTNNSKINLLLEIFEYKKKK